MEWFIGLNYNLMPQIIQNLMELKNKLNFFLNIKIWPTLDVWYIVMV